MNNQRQVAGRQTPQTYPDAASASQGLLSRLRSRTIEFQKQIVKFVDL